MSDRSTPTTEHQNRVRQTPVIPLHDGVVFPDTVITVTLQSPEALAAVDGPVDEVLLVPRFGDDRGQRYARVGVLATVEDRRSTPDGSPALTLKAVQRARVGVGVIGVGAGLWVEAEPIDDEWVDGEIDDIVATLAGEYRATAEILLEKIGGRQLRHLLRDVDRPGALADSIAHWPELSFERRVELLEAVDVGDRLRLALGWLREALAAVELRERIQNDVAEGLEKQQREALLRRQMDAIRSELDDGDDDAIAGYRSRLDAAIAEMPEATSTAISKEIDRLERTGNESMEANWIRTWLDTVFELPWGERRQESLDLTGARTVLDRDHTGLDEVKDRLIEFLAIRKLRADRAERAGETDEAGSADGPTRRRRGGVILSLVGPPGVGKTSLGESIAEALGRDFVRVSLGGVRDEAEIRGHRRTYVGARPGRLVRALSEAGSMNPVVLLDEVDKVGGDWRGDPSAALLEVLDPAQNHSFRDHYLEFELDLSDVVFVATANVLDTIPGPLLDRMDVITLDGYSAAEKAAIARDHLLPRLQRDNALDDNEVVITDAAIEHITADYTREAGVRRLERLLDKALRKSATRIAVGDATAPVVVDVDDLRDLLGRAQVEEPAAERLDRPGVAAGLAVTGAGGDVLFVETALVDGEGEPILTGQLGDVMKESAVIARSLVAGRAAELGVEVPAGKRLHVHFPAGAVPKDGPSAGITMTTALVSLLTGRQVRSDVGMTGEVTLQGRVLPIGGVKQKLLAAHRGGLRTVIIPAANAEDLDDVPSEVLEHLDVHPVADIDQVLALALTPA
ncbi:MAG: endopeptidase La [Acidimicrobiales bacterium]